MDHKRFEQAPRCWTCKHYEEDSGQLEGSGWGACMRMDSDGGCAVDAGSFAYAMDDDMWNACVRVSHAFGCVMYEDREEQDVAGDMARDSLDQYMDERSKDER